MAKYQMYFDTKDGWKLFNVDVDEDETLDDVMPDILREVRDNGFVLEGQPEGQGDIYVTCDGRDLDLSLSLPDQGVRSNDVLRVAVGLEVPSLQLSRQNQMFDVIRREELFEGDDIIVGKTILRFHVGKQRQQTLNRQATFIERLQEGRSFKQTVYFMSLVGGIAGVTCWVVAPLIAFALDVQSKAWVTVINFSTLGMFIGGLSIGFNDKWLGDRVVGRWILTGALAGAAAGAVGGLLSLLIQAAGSGATLLERGLSWMITGALIGFVISMRWFAVNKNRVLHGLIGGLFGGLLGGLAYSTVGLFIRQDVAQALGYIITGGGITCGISLAPILFRKAVLEFVSSGDRKVLAKYARSRKEWEIHHGGKYTIGSLSAAHTHTMFTPEVQIFIPDQLVEEKHAVLLSKGGKYFVEPHPSLGLDYGVD